MLIRNVFNTVNSSALYRVVCQVYPTSTNITSVNIIADDGSATTTLASYGSNAVAWIGIDFTATVLKGYRNMKISLSVTTGGGTEVFYVKNLQAFYLQKAEVQDSELNWAGRRTSYYEGTKMTSTDINVDSADTIDGGPVITVNTVNSDQPSYNPLGVSTIITGTTNTNQAQ